MPTIPSTNRAKTSKYSITLLLALIVAGLAGNYFRYPIFLNIDFLFGSIFAMLALQFFGLGRGVIAAALIAVYTWFLLNHPYAMIIMTAEVATVGWLMARRKMGLVLADTLYWLVIGMPLVYLFYHVVMDVPFSNTYINMTKETVNGIANALVARLVFNGYALRTRSSLTSYREIVYNLLAFFVLCPSLILLAVESRTEFNKTELHIRTSLIQENQLLHQHLETLLDDGKSAILNLAEMAASRPPEQMQPFLEQAKRSEVYFLYIGLQDREATTRAIFPLIDELGQSTIGKSYADRPYLPLLKQTLKPMLSEVVISRVGTPAPMIAMLSPVVVRGEYGGYVSGILNVEQIKTLLANSSHQNATLFTLLDKYGNVIITNRTDQTVMTPFVRGKGVLNRLDAGISQWVSAVDHNIPYFERWKQSFYVVEAAIGDLAEWKLILEQPVAPFQKSLYDHYADRLTLLFLILLVTLALAEFLSRRIAVTLGKLRMLTHELPVRLATDGAALEWPESGINETYHLINNFREMADSLSEKFIEIKWINESLEQRVDERTKELRDINELFTLFMRYSPIYAFIHEVTSTESLVLQSSENYQQMLGIPGSEMVGKSMAELFPAERAEKITADNWRVVSRGQILTLEEDYNGRSYTTIKFPIFFGDKTLLAGYTIDITERKQLEEEVRQSLETAQNTNATMNRLLKTLSHEFRSPLGVLIGRTDFLDRYWDRMAPEKLFEHNKLIQNAAYQLTTLINSVISFNQLGNDRSFSPPQLLDIGEICSVIAAEVGEIWNTGHEFNSTIASDCGTAILDQFLFRRVLENLMTNAFRYTPADGKVSLKVYRENKLLYLEISDTGIGIPEEDHKLIFEAFYRCPNVEGRRGLGLGLSIVHEALQQMGGTITVNSRIGEGTTMRVEIPICTRS